MNTTLLGRHDFSAEQTDNLKKAYRLIFGKQSGEASVGRSHDGMAQAEAEMSDDDNVMYLINFIRRSTEGVHGRYREGQRRDRVLSNPVR